MRQRIEALIVLTTNSEDEFIDGLPPHIPFLLLGGPRASMQHDAVRVLNSDGVSLAINHLAELGHRNISYVGSTSEPNAAERVTAYRELMTQASLAPFIDVIPSTFSEEGGYTAARALLDRDTLPTALICGNARCAFGVLETLVREGVGVPHDISLVGFDDSTIARLPFVNLTTVKVDATRMAEHAISVIRERLRSPQHESATRIITPTLVVRQSTAPPTNPSTMAAMIIDY